MNFGVKDIMLIQWEKPPARRVDVYFFIYGGSAMKMKKSVIITCLFILFIGIFFCYFYISNRKTKEKKGGLTLYEVGAKETNIEYNNNLFVLDGEKRKEFIDILKDISKGNSVDIEENIKYDMILDFNNGYSGKISTEKKIFLLVNDANGKEYYNVSDDNMDKIKKLVN